MKLGILAGEYNGNMSFEDISSWYLAVGDTATGCITQQFSDSLGLIAQVHSSEYGLLYSVSSTANLSAQIDFNTTSWDINYRISPYYAAANSTHLFNVHLWASASTLDEASVRFAGSCFGITAADSLNSVVFCGFDAGPSAARVIQFFAADAQSGGEIKADDIVIMYDPIRLHVDWDFEINHEQHIFRTAALGGQIARSDYGMSKAWSLPIKNIPQVEALTINRWQRLNRPLVFQPDTNDPEGLYIVKIANQDFPFRNRSKPNSDEYDGIIRLESIKEDLIF